MSSNPELADIWKPRASVPAGGAWNDPVVKMIHLAGERITGAFAHALLDKAGLLLPAPKQPLVVLDNACGTGVVTSVLLQELGGPAKAGVEVVCGDCNPLVVQATQELAELEKWEGVRAEVIYMQASHLHHLSSRGYRILDPG